MFATLCNRDSDDTPLPSSGVEAIALRMSARLFDVAPVIPNSARSSAERGGTAVPPATVVLIRLTIFAR